MPVVASGRDGVGRVFLLWGALSGVRPHTFEVGMG